MDHLSVVDYVVFISVLFSSSLIGVFYAWKEKRDDARTTDHFLMGGRSLPLLPVALSLLVSFQSAILILGASGEMYTRGTTYWWSTAGISASALLTCVIFVPVFYDLGLTSVYEYLELRFRSRLVRRFGAFLYVLVTVLYLSIAIYAPSVALHAVTGWPLWSLILSAGVVCTFYCVVGGIKAVVWTDAVQAVFMLAGLTSVAVVGSQAVGGLEVVWRRAEEAKRIIYFDPTLDPFVYMSSVGVIVGQVFSWLGWYGINQSAVQRYCGMRSINEGRTALLLNIPALFLVVSLVCLCGLVMFSFYDAAGCDPLASGMVEDRDQLLPHFVLEVLGAYPGLAGLFVACLYSGTLSSVSSGLNSLAAVVWEDFLKTSLKFSSLSDKRATNVTKGLSLLFGVIATGLSFAANHMGGVLQAALSTMGAVNGPLTGIFLLGVSVPWANKTGAVGGAIFSAIVCGWLCIGALVVSPHSGFLPSNVTNCNATEAMLNATFSAAVAATEASGFARLYNLSYVLYDLLGIILVFLVALPLSWATGGEDVKSLNEKLFNPWVRRLLRVYLRRRFRPSITSSKKEKWVALMEVDSKNGNYDATGVEDGQEGEREAEGQKVPLSLSS